MLLADSMARGEISLHTRVGDVLPGLAAAEAGSITVTELCTHTSGLPPMCASFRQVAAGSATGFSS